MAILPIYTYAHSVLRKKARPFKGVNDAIVRLGHDMMETMHRANGIGLAANQVGVLQRDHHRGHHGVRRVRDTSLRSSC